MLDSKIISRLSKTNLDLDEYYVLYCIHKLENWHNIVPVDTRVYRDLIDKKLIDDRHVITNKGIDLMHEVLGSGLMPKEEFQKFWDCYPVSDGHGMYPKTRILKVNKPVARALVTKIIKEGTYTLEDLCNAAKNETRSKKISSVGQNNLRYMKAVVTWLRQEAFVPWIKEPEAPEIDMEQGILE